MRTEWHGPPVTADASAEQYWRISSGEQTGSRSLYRKRWWHASGMIAGSERPWHAPSPGWTLRLCIGAYESRTAGAYSAEWSSRSIRARASFEKANDGAAARAIFSAAAHVPETNSR